MTGREERSRSRDRSAGRSSIGRAPHRPVIGEHRTDAIVTLYGKAGCHLCEEAREAIEPLRAELGFELREVDVALDPVLHRRYGERIPVVEVDGEELCELGVEVAELRARVGKVSA